MASSPTGRRRCGTERAGYAFSPLRQAIHSRTLSRLKSGALVARVKSVIPRSRSLGPSSSGMPATNVERSMSAGSRHVREQIRVAVAVACDRRANFNPRRRLGPRAEHRPALEVLARAWFAERKEVVPVEKDVDPERLRLGRRATDRPIVSVLRLYLQRYPYRPVSIERHWWRQSHRPFSGKVVKRQ